MLNVGGVLGSVVVVLMVGNDGCLVGVLVFVSFGNCVLDCVVVDVVRCVG